MLSQPMIFKLVQKDNGSRHVAGVASIWEQEKLICRTTGSASVESKKSKQLIHDCATMRKKQILLKNDELYATKGGDGWIKRINATFFLLRNGVVLGMLC